MMGTYQDANNGLITLRLAAQATDEFAGPVIAFGPELAAAARSLDVWTSIDAVFGVSSSGGPSSVGRECFDRPGYIVLTQRVGDEVSGLRGLMVSIPEAGVVATLVAGPAVMSLEPAVALVIGLIVLRHVPGVVPVLGIGFVVVAGIGAERTGAREQIAH